MLRFLIVPVDSVYPSTSLIVHDAAGVLDLVKQLDCKAANVEQDGTHAFSVMLTDAGVWSISQRSLTLKHARR